MRAGRTQAPCRPATTLWCPWMVWALRAPMARARACGILASSALGQLILSTFANRLTAAKLLAASERHTTYKPLPSCSYLWALQCPGQPPKTYTDLSPKLIAGPGLAQGIDIDTTGLVAPLVCPLVLKVTDAFGKADSSVTNITIT